MSAILLSSNLFLLAVPKIIKYLVILGTVFFVKIPKPPSVVAPSRKTILFNFKKEISAGEIQKDNQRIVFLAGRASALALKIGSNLVVKLHQP